MLFPVSIIEGGNQEVHCRRRKIENTEKKRGNFTYLYGHYRRSIFITNINVLIILPTTSSRYNLTDLQYYRYNDQITRSAGQDNYYKSPKEPHKAQEVYSFRIGHKITPYYTFFDRFHKSVNLYRNIHNIYYNN